jgi:uncharacterized membrane protein (DUF4010 family)
MFEQLRPFLVALAIGLLIGIERERSKKTTEKINTTFGMRTIAVIALLGAIAAFLNEPVLRAVIGGFVALIILAGYGRKCWSNKGGQIGLTTEISVMTTFVLGYLAYHDSQLAIILSVMLAVLLAVKERIHSFVHSGIEQKEMSAALTFMVIYFVILPILPNEYIDPWSLINPTKIWLLFAFIFAIEFSSYVVNRKLGARFGVAVTGLFGGLTSATAATLSLASQGPKSVEGAWLLLPGILMAEVSSMAMQLVILHTIAPKVSVALSLILVTPIVVGLLITAASIASYNKLIGANKVAVTLDNPLTLKRTAWFAFLISFALILVKLAMQLLGSDGTYLVSSLVGLVSVRAATLGIGNLANSGDLTTSIAAGAIFCAIFSNILVKLTIIGRLGGLRLLMVSAPALLIMLASGVLVYFGLLMESPWFT